MEETLDVLPHATISYPDNSGQIRVVKIDHPSFTIGRLRSNNLQIVDSYVSRVHAEIAYQNGHFYLRDKNSTGGCLINGERIEDQILNSGDKIQLGSTNPVKLTFEVQEVQKKQISKPHTISVEENTRSKLITIITPSQTRFLNTSLIDSAGYISDATLTRLKTLNETVHKMLTVHSTQNLLEVLLDAAMSSLPAERGVVLINNSAAGTLEVSVMSNRSENKKNLQATQAVQPSLTIVDQVYKDNVAVRSYDAMEDTRFALTASIIQQAIHSVMCAPISSTSHVWGVCYIDNLLAHTQFNDEELEYFLALTKQAGLMMDNLHLIEELQAAQEKLIANEKLATLGKFSTGIAHELKNQLTTLTAAEILMAYTEDQDLRKLIQLILNAQQRMLSMINEIRDFARQDTESYVRNLQPFCPVIEEAISFSRFDACVKASKIETNFQANPSLFLNKDKIMQVVMNLLRNAAQSLTSGGSILVRITEENSKAILSVTDTGCGIPEDQIDYIWKPFYTTKGAEGTGLGLGICQRIIEGHKGTITCESTVGKGSCFTVALPIPGEP